MSSDLMSLIEQAGFTGQAAQTMYAIVMAESGGNAYAHNGNAGTGDDSYGLAQINMIGSLGPERLKQYGLSSADALYDPLTNLKVAYALSNHGTDFSPWTTYTRGTYKQFLGQSGAQVDTSGSAGGGGSMTSGTAAPTEADYESALGPLQGLLQGVPELKSILNAAIHGGYLNGVYKPGGWTTTEFQQAIEASKWYRTNSSTTREMVSLKYSDPAEYHRQAVLADQQVTQMAASMGVSLTTSQINSIAQGIMYQGWTQATIQHAIGYDYTGGAGAKGQAAQFQQQLSTIYADYGIPASQQTLDKQVQQLLQGAQTIDTYKQYAINSAKSLYPSLTQQLDQGLTIKDIADPYIQTMANTLEIDPNTINITDPLIKRALQGTVTTNSNGSTSATSVPLYQFESTLRSDPRWAKTQNARDTVSSALVKIGNDFGFSVG